MANVKVGHKQTNKHTDRAKTICPPTLVVGGIKSRLFTEQSKMTNGSNSQNIKAIVLCTKAIVSFSRQFVNTIKPVLNGHQKSSIGPINGRWLLKWPSNKFKRTY